MGRWVWLLLGMAIGTLEGMGQRTLKEKSPYYALVFVRGGELWTVEVGARSVPRRLTFLGGLSRPSFSPDGSLLLAERRTSLGSDLVLFERFRSSPRFLTNVRRVAYALWSPGGKHVACLTWPPWEEGNPPLRCSVLWVRDVDDRPTPKRIPALTTHWPVAFSSDEVLWVVETKDGIAQRLLRVSGSEERPTSYGLPEVGFDRKRSWVAFAPKGQFLAYLSTSPEGWSGHIVMDRALRVWEEWKGGQERDSASPFPLPLWRPDGEAVLFDHTNLTSEAQAGVWLSQRKGNRFSSQRVMPGFLGGEPLRLTGMAWSPDGLRIALGIVGKPAPGWGFSQERVVVLEVPSGKVVATVEEAREPTLTLVQGERGSLW